MVTPSAALVIQIASTTVNWNDLQRSTYPAKWSISVADSAVTNPRLIIGEDVLNLEALETLHQDLLEGIGNVWMGAFSYAFDRLSGSLHRTQRVVRAVQQLNRLVRENWPLPTSHRVLFALLLPEMEVRMH